MLTVITAADNRKLCALADLKADLGISGSADDTRLNAVIDRASALIRSWTRRNFAAETVLETLDPTNSRGRRDDALVLARYPVIAVSALTLNGEAVTAAEIEIDAATGMLYRLDLNSPPARVAWASGRAIVTYRAGYKLPGDDAESPEARPTLPEDLSLACLTLSVRIWKTKDRDVTIRGVQYSEGSRIEYGMGQSGASGGVPSDIAAMIGPHTRMVF